MARLSLSLLGPLHVTLDGQPVSGFESTKVRALLVYLAVEAARPQGRSALAGLLWPEQPEQVARNNLRQALANLRQALADQRAQPPFLLINRETAQFNSAADHWLDVALFRSLLAACHAHAHRQIEQCVSCAQRMSEAAQLYRGNFLDQFSVPDSVAFEEWAALKREALHQHALEALAHLTTYHERRGEYEQARQYAARQLELDPWREEAHRQLMQLLALLGQRSAALAQYEACRHVLAEALGVEPEEATTALYEQIRAGRSSELIVLSAELSESRSITQNSKLNIQNVELPAQATTFVGREAELAELADLLGNPACRLVTIVGPGGIGKTRLALQAAAEQTLAFADGVFWVPLTALASADFLVSTIADVLKWTFQGQDDPKEQLLSNLSGKNMLLVLDNFEHLLPAAPLLTEILQRAPNVQLLVTSRERLRLQWEWVFDIEGLAYPRCDRWEPLETYSAVQLFVQRARQVRRRFALTGSEEPGVVRICRFVEGMPLGIELTAAAVRERSCREIADQIETNLSVLATSLVDVPARHRNLRAVFDHSWQLLSPEQQRVFRQVSVFRGGFQVDAAAAVAGASEPTLTALIDKSLLRRNEQPQRMWRYDMHEVVRQYAFEQLRAAAEVEWTHERHVSYFVKLAEEAEPLLAGPDQKLWLDRLEHEHDNLRAALHWTLERGEAELAARLGGALWRFWWMHGHLSEGRAWLEQVLAPSNSTSQAPARRLAAAQAKAFHGAGVLADEQGDYAQARSFYEGSLALRRELGDRQGMASLLNSMGVGAYYQGDYPRAQALYEQSLALKRELGDKSGAAGTLGNLAVALSTQGDYARAQALYEQSLALFQELGDRSGVALTLDNLGAVALDQHEVATAQTLFRQSLPLFQELGDQDGIAECLEGLAGVAAEKGQTERAARLFGAAEALREAIGAPWAPIERARYDALISSARAQLDEANWSAAWAAGRALPLEQAIAYALAEGDATREE